MVKKISWKVYLIAGIVTLVIFSSGIGLGFFISENKFSTLKQELETIQTQQKDVESEILLANSLGKGSCETLSYEIEKMTSIASNLGERIGSYGSEMLKDSEISNLKKYYMLTLIEYWYYWESFKKNCNSSVNTILYFYSLNNCNDCEPQGYMLSFLKQKYPDKMMVFSLDADEDLYSITLLKRTYEVNKTPTLIINNKKYEGLIDLNELNRILSL